MKMTLKQARRELSKLGFTFDPKYKSILDGSLRFGTIAAEPYNVFPNHFIPHNRHVYIARAKNGCYITSSISGEYRKYRAHKHNTYRRDVGNIFGLGNTLDEAVNDFVNKFKSKTYNVAK